MVVKRLMITMIPVYPEAVDLGKSVAKSMVTPYHGRDGSDCGMLSP